MPVSAQYQQHLVVCVKHMGWSSLNRQSYHSFSPLARICNLQCRMSGPQLKQPSQDRASGPQLGAVRWYRHTACGMMCFTWGAPASAKPAGPNGPALSSISGVMQPETKHRNRMQTQSQCAYAPTSHRTETSAIPLWGPRSPGNLNLRHPPDYLCTARVLLRISCQQQPHQAGLQ